MLYQPVVEVEGWERGREEEEREKEDIGDQVAERVAYEGRWGVEGLGLGVGGEEVVVVVVIVVVVAIVVAFVRSREKC